MQKFKPLELKPLLFNILRIIIGAVLGYAVYYYALMEILSLYSTLTDELYIITSLVALVASMAACILLVFILSKGKISKNVFYVIAAVYFCLLILVFFGRPTLGRTVSLNIFNSVKACMSYSETLLQTILNFIIVIPLAYFFKNISFKKSAIFFAVISVLIEVIQYILARGVLDLLDIICYFAGLTLGYFIFRKLKIDFIKA